MTPGWNPIAWSGLIEPTDWKFTGLNIMKIVTALLVVAAFGVAADRAEAKGCIKGAVVGGVAGHYAGHHGLLGAAAGCLYGRHRAKQQEQQQGQDQRGHGLNQI
jgi:hypothetical protein